MSTAPVEEVHLQPSPSDGISCVRFSPDASDWLLASSWDKSLRLYDVPSNRLRLKVDVDHALLACSFGATRTQAFSGGVGGLVGYHDLEVANSTTKLGSHDKAAAHIRYSAATGQVFSGSWDGTVSAWDPRSTTQTTHLKQSGKVYAMSTKENLLVVGLSTKRISLYDIRRASAPIQDIDSPLKYQIRCIELFPDAQGYAIGSTEGRVALEYVDAARKGYAFKCHREKISDSETYVFPINAIAFHPRFGTFATGGCDGMINVWDGENKKRINQFLQHQTARYPTR
ncbi:hypothetical protein DYB26_011103 [Aphanomyces astaci]|uniref:Uncharacterized protein n=1 Tax=Aphanomyces astaci TaxID=112090 RepID=A0A397CW69_APHAT|nr:hypothetical protein DYB34_012392 [Aphanomyces astaci]RHY54143.1 hypothetical protein DYB38_006381 [Aphanomyces astaci]RHY98312.1 hypothetical protein DYB31_011582 [Aphanomyces astaci]RHZ21884.1 hypothetical protein DYB26_011103 [Aphanomyces astaci]